MDTVRGSVLRVVWGQEDSGYKVISIRANTGKNLIITGEFGPEIIPESVADFHGEYKMHPKYGHQFKVGGYSLVHNQEELKSIQLFIDTIAPNIGSERSALIVTFFKNDIIKILDETPERLLEVPGIGKVSADSLSQAWIENRAKWEAERAVYSLRAFLYSVGLKERRIKKVLRYFSSTEFDAEEQIRKDPYQLINIEGFGFSTVDYIARNLGISEESPERLRAFLVYCLEVICPSFGHLYLFKNEVVTAVNTYCSENNTRFLGRSVVLDDIETALLTLTEKLVVEGDKVYPKKQHLYESASAKILHQIKESNSDLLFLTKAAVEDFIIRYEHENNITLSDEQRLALFFFAEKKVFVITGAPGTGKTSVLKAIVQLALLTGLKLTCMTPTGISAKKLASTIGYDAYTIHRRLGFRSEGWTYNETNKFETDIAIMDESSMIDQEVFYRLLSALRTRTHVIFVGDHNQLPSVGAGNVLRELINCKDIPVVVLDKIFRQSEASDIIKAAHQIIHGNTSLNLFKEDPQADIFFLRVKEIYDIEKIVVKFASRFKDDRRLFQIITPRNTGPLGVDSLNQLLQEALNPPGEGLNELKLLGYTLRKGDRVMVRKNDYENEIYNGDIGKVIVIASNAVTIKIDERLVDIPIEEVEDKLKLAYSLTCHKSQGLEYPIVILLMVNQHGKNLLQRNLLYTALTRAKEKVIVIGHGSAVEKSIENMSVVKRNTMLGERLCCLQTKKLSLLTQLTEQEISQNVQTSEEPSLSEIASYYPMATTEE